MQIITNLSSERGLLLNYRKDIRMTLLIWIVAQVHPYTLMSAFVDRLFHLPKEDVPLIWTLSNLAYKSLSNLKMPDLLKEPKRGQNWT